MTSNNSIANVNPKKIFVFDLDQTLIEGHTGGVYNRNPKIPQTSFLINLKNILTKIKSNGYKLFLNSRGNYESCIMVLKDIGFMDLFTNNDGTINVYAANIPLSSFGYQIMKKYIAEPSIQISDGGPKWAEYKTYFLSALVNHYDGIQQDDIVFFDDTIPNIEKAKSSGFKNSYSVNVPLNNLISLLIPFLCEPCKTCPPCQEYKYKFGDATKAATKVVSDKAQTTAKVVTNTVGNVAAITSSGIRGWLGNFSGRGGKKTIRRNKKKYSKKINRKQCKTIKRKNRNSNKINNKK